jgi:hypothetical protein
VTVEDVRARVEKVKRMYGDDEAQHSEEDSLRTDVLIAISMGAVNAAELALESLKTSELDFNRWCA